MANHWAQDYAPVIYELFRTGKESVPDMIPALFDVRESTKTREDMIGIGTAPTEQWESYNKNGQVATVSVDRGYGTTFTHVTYALEYVLRREVIDDNNLGIVEEELFQIGLSAQELRQQHGASIFNNAFSSDYVGADGVSLCNDSHPYGPDNTGQTYDNAGTSALTYDAVKAARLAMRKFVDSQGNPLMRRGSLILAPVELENTLIEITNTDKKPGSAENDANAIMGFRYMVWDYLTDTDNWFLLDPTWTKRYLKWFERTSLDFGLVSADRLSAKYQWYMRYSFGWTDPRFVYGNEV